MKKHTSWNKGYTKYTHPGLLKISQTFKKRKIDNFKVWKEIIGYREKIKDFHRPFKKDERLAFLIGLTLGDGHISEFPRSERIEITFNSKYPKLIEYTKQILFRVFKKESAVNKYKNQNCVKLSIYQQKISKRLNIPSGSKKLFVFVVPKWIKSSKKLKIALLKGLFEAEGSLSVHLPTYTYNFQFSNKNQSLLKIVKELLVEFGFHPECRLNATRLRRRREVDEFVKIIAFRSYS